PYRIDVGQECPTYRSGLIALLALGFPITGVGLAVALRFDLALDRVTLNLAVVLGGELVAVALAGDAEGKHSILEGGIIDLGLGVVAAQNHTGDLVAFHLELHGLFEAL